MKQLTRILCVLMLLCLLLSAAPVAHAAERSPEGQQALYDALYKDKTWDEVVTAFLEKNGLDPDKASTITMGYYNTVTGEEHYLHGDQYMVTGSMYKVPLNMAFAEKVANGELEWDTKYGSYRLSALRDETIIYSNNDLAKTLWTILSNGQGYHRYREIIAPYMGEDPETVDQKYYENNFFTARQMIYCLKLLYDNPDRFPTIVETMQQAEPNKYFKMREKRFDIAHKYGFLVTEYHQYINDCGIAFTDDPILLVIFTDNVSNAYTVITEFCTLMCDYAQYHTAERLAAEQAEAEALAAQAKAEEEAAARAAEEAARQPGLASLFAPQPTEPADASEEPARPQSQTTSIAFAPFVAGVAVLIAALIAIALLVRWRRRYGLRLPWAMAAALLCALALLLCTLAVSRGTLLARPKGEPEQAVSEFFDALQTGDFDGAYAHLQGGGSLGLETPPATPAGRLLYDALRQSYAYTLIGTSTKDDLSARQQIQIRYLDIGSMEADTKAELADRIGAMARERDSAQVYDADNNYLPAFAQEAYAAALSQVLSHAADYYTTAGLQLTLDGSSGSWRIIPDQDLLKALAGGLSY